MSSIVFIDGDILLYKIGFACQESSVQAIIDDIPRGEFKNRTEARDAMSSLGIMYTNEQYEVVVKPKPWKQVAFVIDGMIKNIIAGSGCDTYRIYVEGKDNFRKSLATIKPYKASPARSAMEKPFHYDKIKQCLIQDWGAVVTDKIETDDYISIATSLGYYGNKQWVGATTDKDAKQTEGLLYNWDKMDKPTLITPMDGAKSFWKQMLTGDTIDNIQGCRGVGDKHKAMTEIDSAKSVLEMYKVVRYYYYKAAETKGLVTDIQGNQLSVYDEMRENMALLYMFRHKPLFDGDRMILESDIKLDELEALYAGCR